jgi:hypothetical protein
MKSRPSAKKAAPVTSFKAIRTGEFGCVSLVKRNSFHLKIRRHGI